MRNIDHEQIGIPLDIFPNFNLAHAMITRSLDKKLSGKTITVNITSPEKVGPVASQSSKSSEQKLKESVESKENFLKVSNDDKNAGDRLSNNSKISISSTAKDKELQLQLSYKKNTRFDSNIFSSPNKKALRVEPFSRTVSDEPKLINTVLSDQGLTRQSSNKKQGSAQKQNMKKPSV